ncbi:MAG: DNA translocase FtsK, partial [Pseudobdellovibrionaceae bacterium]|nr:DNA translocase FtsK [Pseudobdellovibrionaceae bacterium]
DLVHFEKIPHLAMPIVTDSRQAVTALKWAVGEMEKRYRSMSRFGARGIEAFNETVTKLTEQEKQQCFEENRQIESTPGKINQTYYWEPLPYLVIIVEEFADLMSVDKGHVEHSVIRLAQKARACGIHLILCLQSPRKEFVTGAIKSNIPGRIAFKTASAMESRIILDEGGAERLLASGDMLFRGPGSAHLVRYHGPFLKDRDIHSVTDFWRKQEGTGYLIDLEAAQESLDSSNHSFFADSDDNQDELLSDIYEWLKTQKEVSASLLQRRFSLGYPRAARLIEMLEARGIVGPANGSKPRPVMISGDLRKEA